MTNTTSTPSLHGTTTLDSSVVHEHGWRLESRHATSLGSVLYVRCDECGVRRIDIQEYADRPPVALSVETARMGS